jgi:hypothetical protein
LLIAAGAIVSTAAGFFLLPRVSAHKIDKSVAVLPFQNLSSDPENAFLGDGIQDDILTNLSSIRDTFAFMHDRIDAHLRESDCREIASLPGYQATPRFAAYTASAKASRQ